MSNCCSKKHGNIEINRNENCSDNIKDARRKYTFRENLQYYVKEYCEGGTIHGFRYLSEDRTIFEKIWWFFSVILSVFLCINLVIITYEKWQYSPVIVSFATKETPIWEVPFPAITICPETKSRPTIFNFTKYLYMKQNNIPLDSDSEKKFNYLSLICDRKENIQYSDDHLAGEELFDFFDEVQPKFLDNISECKYLGESYKCSELFIPIVTDEGICYTFNLLDRSEIFDDKVVHYKNYHKMPKSDGWTLEYGYPPHIGVKTYPRRALFSGAKYALEGKLTTYDDELDYACGTSLQGWKMQISHPSRMPRVRDQHFQVPLDKSIKAAIAPDMTVTSEKVKNYNARRRNCYFPSEKQLNFFKIYTQQNCQIECKTHYTYNKCGCINFYMPRISNMSVCSAGSLKCIYNTEHELQFSSIDKKLKAQRGDIDPEEEKLNCDCLPICTSMYYNTETSLSDWQWRKKYQPNKNESQDKYKQKHMSYFQVFFKGNQFITLDRSELFGPTDFLANIGGLLGLFLGFSLLTFVEIIYYLSTRIICNIVLFGRKNWSGKTD